ncbi:MAG: ISAs1 family transposase, partial [Cetobacterium sp.]
MTIDDIRQHFQSITDKRQSAKVDYPLFDIIFATLCSILAGGNGWSDIHEYVKGHHAWFKRLGMFERGVPVDDTFARLISLIEPELFQHCFAQWMAAIHKLTDGEVVAIDGKTLRSSYNRENRRSALHMVSAYASANQLVLGQFKTAEKSNEITAIPELLKLLKLDGALVTIDAMGCQTDIADAILAKQADYLLAVKGNQPTLAKAVTAAFAACRQAPPNAELKQAKISHGRLESRTYHVLDASELVGDFSAWPELTSIIMAEQYRATKGKPATLEYRYYISSKELSPSEAGHAIRAHWGIEAMHWILDVSMGEDNCQIYRENGAENLAYMRHIALNALRKESTKASVPVKQKRCMMNTDYLLQVLTA